MAASCQAYSPLCLIVQRAKTLIVLTGPEFPLVVAAVFRNKLNGRDTKEVPCI